MSGINEAITTARMAAIDTNCEYLGIRRLQLMENAGAAVAAAVRRYCKNSGRDTCNVLVIAGKGNNGGDALVAARHLSDLNVTVILLGRQSEIKTEEALHNWSALSRTYIPAVEITDSTRLGYDLFERADVIIDGIFGTGIKGKIREPESTAIDLINRSKAYVIAVDVPSGLNPDTIEEDETGGTGVTDRCVKADMTVTFHRIKIGLLSDKARGFTGSIEIAPIGIPEYAEILVGPGDVLPFSTRAPDSHKGDAGRVLIIGGGPYTGAPTLAAMAALRAGADIVTVAVPGRVEQTIASYSPNLIVRPLSGDHLVNDDVTLLSGLIAKHDVAVIGMGLGTDEESLGAVRSLLPQCNKVVIDADALSPSAMEFPIGKFAANVIITPHAGEFKRLSGIQLPDRWQDRVPIVRDFASENEIVVLLKGMIDVISDGKTARLNRTGNPGMTVGGTGDVLAGLSGALFAKHEAFESACAAAFINGAAGDLAYKVKGYGLLATDVIDNIPEVIWHGKYL